MSVEHFLDSSTRFGSTFRSTDTSGPRIFMSRKDEKEHPEHPKAHSQHFVATDIEKRLPFGIPFAGTRFHPISTKNICKIEKKPMQHSQPEEARRSLYILHCFFSEENRAVKALKSFHSKPLKPL